MDRTIEQRALAVRKFNRFYTNIIGLVNKNILESPYSLAEVRVMLEIDGAGNCRASDLTKLLEIDPGYLSRILARFISEGLVIKEKLVHDARVQVLSLTDKGREVYQKLADESTRQIIRLLAGIPNHEQGKLVGCLSTVEAILSRQSADAIYIRDQEPGDAGYIAYRHGVLYTREYQLAPIFEQYVLESLVQYFKNRQQGNIWVAEFSGQIAGFIGIVGIDGKTAQLRWFLIEPEYRGAGLGRRLLATALDYCQQQGFNRVFLWTFHGLAAAQHLYRKCGFELTEQVQNDTWKPGLREERWEMTLTG